MWSLLWIRLGRRATFWSKLLLFSSVLHVTLLSFIFFIFSWQNSIFEIQINRSILRSGAPIVFASRPHPVRSALEQKRPLIKKIAINKPETKKPSVPVKKSTIVEKKTEVKKIAPSKPLVKPAVEKTPIKKAIAQKPAVKNPPIKKVVPQKEPVKKQVAKKEPERKIVSEKKIVKNIPEPIKKIIPKPTHIPAATDGQAIPDAICEGNEPVYIGQKELEILSVQYEIEREVAKHWRPPAGLSKDLTCTIHVLVDWDGKPKQSALKKTSGVLIYDISARMAIAQLQLPNGVRGKEINITFNQ